MESTNRERKGALEKAHEEDERFRALVESVQDYTICVLDPEGVIQTWNPGAQLMTGYAANEIIGACFSRFFLEEDRAAGKPQETLAIAKETGRYEGEVWRIRKDGTRFLAHVVLRPLRKPSGELSGFSKVTRDLTESRAMEARYRTLLEAAPDAIVISGPGGLIELTNLEAERLFGYGKEEMVGQPVTMLIPEELRGGYREDAEQFLQGDFHRRMGAGLELRARKKDGCEIPVEISFSPLEGPEGVSMTAAIRDVTERKRTETRFRMLLESAPDAMVIVNCEGRIELSNAQTEKLFGYSPAELAGRPVEILIPENLHDAHRVHRSAFFGAPRKREMGAGLDLMAQRKDGSFFPVEISLSPLEGPNGTSVTAAIRDVTERVAAVRLLAEKMTELRQSNEALEQFAHIASHDLQEPLRMVASYVQLISKRYKGKLDADADEFIGFAVDGTQRMKRLIEDLLVFSRAGMGAVDFESVRSEDALKEALNNLRASIGESHAEVSYDALPTVATGELQLVQLFQNLVGNAIKYRGERVPRIHISALRQVAEEGEEWVFSVADNGIGIEPQYFDRVFVIFQRLHGRGEYEGTGIGLAICKRVLQQQGGRIWVESEPGKGSIFHFSLPVR